MRYLSVCSGIEAASVAWDHCALGDAADGPIYRALGNSMAVAVLHWLGRRIAAVDAARARDE